MIDVQCYSFLFFASLVSTLLIWLIFHKPNKPTTSLHLPPSPPALPIIGHLHLVTPSLYKSLHRLSSQYGPLLYLRLGASWCLVVSSASVAAEVFKTHDLAFASRPLFAFADKIQYGTSGFIASPYGDYWRFMKKLCVTERFLVSFDEQEKLDQSGQRFNFVPFGAGRRGCPGTTLAFSLMNTAVAALVQCFDWKVEGSKVDMQSGSGMSLTMAHPLMTRPVAHFNPFAASK